MIKEITLAHGNGGKLTHELVSELFVPAFNNRELNEMADGAVFSAPGKTLVFATDSHVVKPIFFPGGDIGELAVTGTVNDLAVMGGRPVFMSCGFIIEEGFPFGDLKRIVDSMSARARECDVRIVAGDTKVVERGAVDGIFINTSGIGTLFGDRPYKASAPRPGDAVIVTGTVGDHGMAIYAGREGIGLETDLESDCASVFPLVKLALESGDVRIMRDPTRGGLATVVNEFVAGTTSSIELYEERIPVKPSVRAICELLGFDPLHVACEGRLVVVTAGDDADKTLAALQSHPRGRESAIIGRVDAAHPGRVRLKTFVGERILDMLVGDMLPRIC